MCLVCFAAWLLGLVCAAAARYLTCEGVSALCPRSIPPALPKGSWSILIAYLFSKISLDEGLIDLASFPMIRGEAVRLHIAICVRSSSVLTQGLLVPLTFAPIKSMSGSFQWPIPAAISSA